jgi:hypothetical protein
VDLLLASNTPNRTSLGTVLKAVGHTTSGAEELAKKAIQVSLRLLPKGAPRKSAGDSY